MRERREPAEVTNLEMAWLAGLLEGEGSFFPGPPSAPDAPVLAIQMTDEDVMRRVARMLDRKLIVQRPRNIRWKQTYHVRLTGRRAVAWMGALRPLMGTRRRDQIDRATASFRTRTNQRIDDAGAREALGLLAAGMSVRSVAERFGVSIWCIYDLRLGRTHRRVHRQVADEDSGLSLPP